MVDQISLLRDTLALYERELKRFNKLARHYQNLKQETIDKISEIEDTLAKEEGGREDDA